MSKESSKPKPSGKRKVGQAIKKFTAPIKVFVGHYGLFVALLFYIAFGALVFQKIEGPHEIYRKTTLKRLLLESRSNFSRIVFNMSLQQPDAYDFNSTWSSALDSYDKVIQHVTLQDASVLKPEIKYNWDYVRSAIFACTVITTIGYGNVTPHTDWGRAFCMWFALMGIPLTLMVIADVGKLIASAVSLLYHRCRAHLPAQVIMPSSKLYHIFHGKSAAVILAVCSLLLYIAAGGYFFTLWEDWSFFDSFYFCFITMTTIGFGDLVPENTTYRIFSVLYIFIGLALTSTAIEVVRNRFAEHWRKVQEISARQDMMEESECELGKEQVKMAESRQRSGSSVPRFCTRRKRCKFRPTPPRQKITPKLKR